MANTILVKKGAGTPSPDSLQEAELALDIVDGSLYSKLNDGEIHKLNSGAGQDGGFGSIDGGNASSIYTLGQLIDGGSA